MSFQLTDWLGLQSVLFINEASRGRFKLCDTKYRKFLKDKIAAQLLQNSVLRSEIVSVACPSELKKNFYIIYKYLEIFTTV